MQNYICIFDIILKIPDLQIDRNCEKIERKIKCNSNVNYVSIRRFSSLLITKNIFLFAMSKYNLY